MKPDDHYTESDYEEREDGSERVQKIRKAQGGRGLSGKRPDSFSMGTYLGERGKRSRRIRRHDKF